MAKVDPGILDGIRGKLNKQFYFRKVNGKVYMSAMPKRKPGKNRKPGKGSVRFREGIDYSLWICATVPELKSLYKAAATGFNSAYTMGIADFMKPPVIESITYGQYKGHPGEPIRIRVNNIIRVKSVGVTIIDAGGNHLEEGDATQARSESEWIYRTVRHNPSRRGTTLLVTAMDYPGNLVSKEIVL